MGWVDWIADAMENNHDEIVADEPPIECNLLQRSRRGYAKLRLTAMDRLLSRAPEVAGERWHDGMRSRSRHWHLRNSAAFKYSVGCKRQRRALRPTRATSGPAGGAAEVSASIRVVTCSVT